MQTRPEQWVELQMLLPEKLAQHILIEIGEVDDADLRKHGRHLGDDVLRPRLADGELVLVRMGGADHLDERFDGEHVVLRGHAAQLLAGTGALVPILQKRGLIKNLPGIGHELRAIDRQRDALGGPREYLDSELVLQFLDG